MTLLCVSIYVSNLAQGKADIARAAEAGADLVELRLDTFTDHYQAHQLVHESILPVIVTCRASWEGGQSILSDENRIRLLQHACGGKTRYLDIELETARRGGDLPVGAPLIVSYHNFDGPPLKLHNIILEMNQRPGQVNKVAFMARSIRDNLLAFEILQQHQKPTIALCMGEAGMISRILAKKFGALLTFASLDEDSATALGQVPIRQLKSLYRWDNLNRHTRVYGVVASPVKHSMSPAIHNAAFDAIGHDGIYLPFLVDGTYESFKAFMEEFLHFPGLDLSGLSITLPHKENALKYLKGKGATIEPLAEQIGAVNTIVIETLKPQKHKLSGYNTDYAAILDSLTAAMNINRQQLAGKRIAVIGAGGTGRTATAALAHYGANITIYNRTPERAQALATEFHATAAPLARLGKDQHDVYLNTTSIGMFPHVEESPFGDAPPALQTDSIVFDAVYNPTLTRMLSQAQAAGAKTIPGMEMFIRQAIRQFELWTGKPAPREVMEQVLRQHLQQL